MGDKYRKRNGKETKKEEMWTSETLWQKIREEEDWIARQDEEEGQVEIEKEVGGRQRKIR